MAEIHFGQTLTPTKAELIGSWIGRQRWYAGKGSTPQVRPVRSFRFDDPAEEVGVEIILVADSSGPAQVLYQVPLTYRGEPLEGLEHALVGTTEHSLLGTRWVYDGCHDPVYATELLAVIQGRARAASSSENHATDPGVTGHRHPDWSVEATVTNARVLSGEQSNTSIILTAEAADGTSKPLICKVFRTIQAGPNPDVELQDALRGAGSDRVPEAVGHLSVTWTDPSGEAVESDLAFAQEFLPDTPDAWRVALAAATAGEDFSRAAHDLGAATAAVHVTLAEALGTEVTTPTTSERLVAEMRTRAQMAARTAPQLQAYMPLIDSTYAQAQSASWPAVQRIHGDYHLGQVLGSTERGWVLLDFEGEPMRSLAERRMRDQWVRDVAGMLRSFDYAAGSVELTHGRDARDWAQRCRTAFLDGYASTGPDPRALGPILTAFELDKALYEVVYEAANRPTWLTIPLHALDRLLAPADSDQSPTERSEDQ